MSERFVPLLDARVRRVALPQSGSIPAAQGALTDRLRRPLHDLRVSVTDRCNFRCIYCMPKEIFGRDYQFLEREQLLSFQEIERLVHVDPSSSD